MGKKSLSGNVIPRSSIDDAPDCVPSRADAPTDRTERFAGISAPPNFHYVLSIEPRMWVLLSPSMPSPFFSIAHVLKMGAQIQMVGIHAQSVVAAGAVVQHKSIAGD